MSGAERQRYLGWAIVALSAIAWSTAGFFTRLIEADSWTVLFWRGVFSGGAMVLVTMFRYRGGTLRAYSELGLPGLLVALSSAAGMLTFIPALRLTAVADVYVIYATVPFITAGFARLALSEKVSMSVLVASAVALVGVVITVAGGGFSGGFLGQLCAFIMTVMIALMTVILRWKRRLALMPALALSALITAFVAFWFSSPLAVSGFDLAMLAIFGVTQNALALILYGIGSRMISAAEATLLTTLDVPLSPLWVWLAFGETASGHTLVGGAIVLVAVTSHLLNEVRRAPERSSPEAQPI